MKMNCLHGRKLLTEARRVFGGASGLEADHLEDPLWLEGVLFRKLALVDATDLKQKAQCECLWYGPAADARKRWALLMEAPQQAGLGLPT